MALRSDAQGDIVSWTGNLPANLRPYTACGWAYISADRNTYHSLWYLWGDTNNRAQVFWYDTSTSTLLGIYVKLGGVAAWYYERPTTITHNSWFFWAISLNSGTSQYPTLYWRSATDTALTSYNQGSGSSATNFTPTVIWTFYDEYNPTEWTNGKMAGLKWWSAVLTADEILSESYALAPKRLNDLVFAVPAIGGDTALASLDIVGQRVGSVTGITIEDGPPVSYGGRIILPNESSVIIPTLSNPGVQDITMTSFRPKVTLTY